MISIGSSVCYGDLGCFNNNAPFFSLYRPFSFLPQSPDLVNPKFMLYTREASTTGHRIRAGDKVGLHTSTFRPDRPTKFLVHGFLDDAHTSIWMQVSALLGLHW